MYRNSSTIALLSPSQCVYLQCGERGANGFIIYIFLGSKQKNGEKLDIFLVWKYSPPLPKEAEKCC